MDWYEFFLVPLVGEFTILGPPGAFGGINPTIDNPTPEYKAVIFAANGLKPIPSKIFEYKSEYRVIKPDTGSSMSEEVQALSNLA